MRQPQAGHQRSIDPRRVLICDDDAGIRSLLSALLEQVPGLTVVGLAVDGVQVVPAVAEARPDVVVMDFEMPGQDGAEATAQLRRGGFRGTVVVFTGATAPDVAARAFGAGADAVVRKDTVAALVTALQGQG